MAGYLFGKFITQATKQMKILRKILGKLASVLEVVFAGVLWRLKAIRINYLAEATIKDKNLKRFYQLESTAKTHLILTDFDELDHSSIVFDLGGYKGDWAAQIFSKYACTVYVFEPVPEYCQNIVDRFKKNQSIMPFCFGLGSKDCDVTIYKNNQASSIHNLEGDPLTISLHDISDFLSQKRIEFVDLMKINIEGGEYDLLDHLISKGKIESIKNILIQFHDFVPDAYERMKKIQHQLSETHEVTFQYEFVWENWTLRKSLNIVGASS